MFTNILMFSLLYARNDHRTPFFAILAAIGVEVLLDLLWLPRYGLVAAAWARLSRAARRPAKACRRSRSIRGKSRAWTSARS